MYNQTHTYVCIYVFMCVIYFRTSLRCLHFIISLWLLSRRAYCYYYFLFSCWLLYQFILFCRFSPFACTFRQWPWFFTSPSCCCFCSCCGWYFAVVVAAMLVRVAGSLLISCQCTEHSIHICMQVFTYTYVYVYGTYI